MPSRNAPLARVLHQDTILHLAAGLAALLLVSALVVRTSDAAFSATTANANDQWSAGDVVLTDDDSGAAMFTVTNMAPSQAETACITVTYSGSLDAAVKLYGSVTGGDGLGTYLDLTIKRGTGGLFNDCTGFSSTETVYTGTLAGFVASHSGFGTGVGSWTPTGGGADDDMVYQFVVTLQDDNAAQGKSTTATFTWEAQNT
jgi:hypothetical protein